MPTENYPSCYCNSPGAKNGLLIRGGDVLERLSGVDVVVLDKVKSHYMLQFPFEFFLFFISF